MLTRSAGSIQGRARLVRGTLAASGPLGPLLRGVPAPFATAAPCLARATDSSQDAVTGTASSQSYLRERPEPAESSTFTAVESEWALGNGSQARSAHPACRGRHSPLPGDNRYEIKDPELILETVWRELERTIGFENMAFPKEVGGVLPLPRGPRARRGPHSTVSWPQVLWLAGAPGAGKGTMSKAIMHERGIEEPPIEVSSLLNTCVAAVGDMGWVVPRAHAPLRAGQRRRR